MQKILMNGTLLIAIVMSFGAAAVFAQRTSDDAAMTKQTFPNCSGEQLALSEAEGEADMGGKRYGKFVFTNISSQPCQLSGYPRFSLLNKAGKVLSGIKVKYDDNFWGSDNDSEETVRKLSVVTLEPKQTAVFQIFYNDGMALDRKKPFPISAKVKVTAPNSTREFVIKSEIQACCGVQVSFIRAELPQ